MRIAVLGAGAIGSSVGGMLALASKDVTLVARRDHAAAINENGLRMTGFLRETVQVRAVERLDFRPDLILLCTKTQHVEEACRLNAAFVRGVPLVTMQNGVASSDIAASVLGREGIIGGVVFFGATYVQPGEVFCINRKGMVIGEWCQPNSDRVRRVADLVSEAVPTAVNDNVRGSMWMKLVINLTNGVPATTGLSVQELAQYPEFIELAVRLMREGLRAIAKAGVVLEPLPDHFTLEQAQRLLELPLPEAMAYAQLHIPTAATLAGRKPELPVYGSTWQSIKRGQPTEVDYLNGEVVRLGQKVGMPTPLNGLMLGMVHQCERRGGFLGPDAVREAVRPLLMGA